MKKLSVSLTFFSVLIFLAPNLAHAAVTTWNSADKSTNITLSGGDFVATGDDNQGVGWYGVRATTNKSAGKSYFELEVTSLAGSSANAWMGGLSTSGHAFVSPQNASIWEYYLGDGNVYCAGSASGNVATLTTGDVLGIGYDADAGTIDFYKNGTASFYQCTSVPDNLYPEFDSHSSSASTINLTNASFSYSPPTGYSAWDAPAATSTVNRLAKFTTTTQTLGDSLFSDDGSDTTLTAGNLFMQIGSLIDTITGGALNFGTTNATSINVGRMGVTTTFLGPVTVNSLATFGNNITVPAAYGIDTATAGALNIGTTTATSITIGSTSATTTLPGTISWRKASTATNCSSSASPAVCGSASAGSVAMATGGSTLVVNTTAVTADSQILITEDSSLGTRLGITCNTSTNRTYSISARTVGASFTIKSSNNPVTNKACLSYWIIN